MASTKIIKNRLKSVRSTQKITLAMKLVASIKFKKSERDVLKSKKIVANMDSQISGLLENMDESLVPPKEFIRPKASKVSKVLFIVYSSNRGMCGGFNVNTAKAIREEVGRLKKLGVSVDIIAIGGKIKGSLSRYLGDSNIEVLTETGDDAIAFFDQLSKRVYEAFESGDYQEISLVYNEFLSAAKTEICFKRVLPLYDYEEVTSCKRITQFDNGAAADLTALVRYNLLMRMHHAFLESAASEHSTRMIAMDSANKNADEMIKKLTLQYNQTRQSAVTNELVEIISGAEAV